MLQLLIVEDEPLGATTAEWFHLEGWTADWAKDPEIAKAKLEGSLRTDGKFDAVVVDRKMGLVGDEGDKLLEWMRDRKGLDYVCVVMLTGYGNTSSATECMRLGADHYIEKPFPVDDLRDVLISGILDRRARELRHAAVFGEATPQQSQDSIYEIIRSVIGDDEITVHMVQTDGSFRTVGTHDAPRNFAAVPPFVKAVLDSRRPFTALTAAAAHAAGAFGEGVRGLIAVPIPSETGQALGVWAIESTMEGALRNHWVDSMEQFGEVLGIAAELAEKREFAKKRQQAANAVMALNEIRHKLSTPVQAIEWKIEELRQLKLPTESQRPLTAIIRNVSTIRNLCYQLSDEASDIPIEKEEFEISEFLRDYVEEFRSETEAKKITLECEGLPKRSFMVRADKRWIGYSLQCLLRNAIEAIEAQGMSGPKGSRKRNIGSRGKIIVHLALPDSQSSQLSISVEDTGIGITEKDRERVFQPLFSTKPERRGVGGVGLYSVQRILVQHGGSASFNTTLGKGATFRLTLPAR